MWKLPDGRDWLWGNLGLALMSRVMLSKSLIQFLLMSRTVFSLCSLTLGQTMLRVMVTSFKRTYASKRQFPRLLYSVPLTPQPATLNPCLHRNLRDTHGQVWLSLLWTHCSFLQGPGAHKVLSVPSKSLFPQSCVSSVFKSHLPPKSNSLGFLSPFARSPGWVILEVQIGSRD